MSIPKVVSDKIDVVYSIFWKDSQKSLAASQGWCVAHSSGASHGYDFEIQKLDQSGRFKSDDEARRYVKSTSEKKMNPVASNAILLLNELSLITGIKVRL